MNDAILPELNTKSALDLVTRMMAIPGKSCEESKIIEFITDQLKAAGLPDSAFQLDSTPKRSPAGGEIGSLIVKLKGTHRKPRRLMMAHVDTVPLCEGCKPVRRGDEIVSADPTTALGADDRAGAAVVLNAALTIIRKELPHPPLTLFWPVQEEIGLNGARYVTKSKLGQPKLCFNWDGGIPHVITIGATGDYALTIEVNGIASHAGAHPEQGVNAIAVAARAIADLTENGWHGLITKGKRTGTSNIGVIQGGDATNVVTPRLSLKAECRSHDPVFRKRIVEEYRKAFERAVKTIKNDAGQQGSVEFQADLKYESFRLNPAEPVVKAAERAVAAVGLNSEVRISNGGLDANWMTAHGFPTVTLGCGQQNVHTVNESLHIESYLNASRIGLALASDVGSP